MNIDQPWNLYAAACLMSMLTVLLENYLFFFLLVIWLIYLFYNQRISLFVAGIAVVIYLFFSLYLPDNQILHHDLSVEVDQPNASYIGIVAKAVVETDKTIQFPFQLTDSEEKVLAIYFKDGQMQEKSKQELAFRSSCVLSGQLQVPDAASNPFEFNYRNYLQNQGITYQLILDDIESIRCKPSSIWSKLTAIRTSYMEKVTYVYDDELASWLLALVFGADYFIDKEIISLFQRWGLSHILAISGLHVGIVVAMLYFLLVRFSLFTIQQAQNIVMLLLPFYALLAGAEPSVLRATGMILTLLILQKFKWKISAVDCIGIVFICLLLFDKYMIYHIGFQLSFLVTIGLLLSRSIFAQTDSRIFQVFQISFIAQMMILPLQIHYFFQFNPLSILLNIIVVPYFSMIVIPFMFFFVLAYWLPPIILQPIEQLFLFIHKHALGLIEWIDFYAFYPLTIGSFPLYYALIYYVLLFLFFMMTEVKKQSLQSLLGILIIFLLLWLKIKPIFQQETIVTMLDIGQGDAIVIELPHRRGVFMIDAGATVLFEEEAVSPNVYERIIRPFLLGKGIDQIDSMFISHEHMDHMGSVSFFTKDIRIEEIIVSQYYDAKTFALFPDIPIAKYQANDQLERKNQLFSVVSPNKDYQDANTNSLTLYTELEGTRWLFTGDATEAAEKQMIKDYPHLQVDFLKVGHHGSNTSSSEAFIQTLEPSVALIPVGRKNRYNHPHDEIIDRLFAKGIETYRTDKHGAISFYLRNKQVTIERFITNEKEMEQE